MVNALFVTSGSAGPIDVVLLVLVVLAVVLKVVVELAVDEDVGIGVGGVTGSSVSSGINIEVVADVNVEFKELLLVVGSVAVVEFLKDVLVTPRVVET